MSNLEIRFLGDFVVKAGGEPVASINKPRLQSLLAYLILHRDAPQFRHHLAGVFWPDSPEAQALTNLRHLVHLLRKALPDGEQRISADSQTLQWNPQTSFTLDVFAFQQIAAKGTPKNLTLEDLEAALTLYQGDLLPACYDEWVSAERESLRQFFIALLDEWVDRCENLRRYPEAITGCQRLAAVEPFHARGSPRLVRLLALNGETPAALKTYQAYVRLLKRELNIDPPVEMQELYADLKRRARQAPPAAGYQSTPPARLPLVSRAAEWQAIQSLWKTTAGGNPRLLLICGEAGIGKTRLAEELTGWAARQGIRTAAAHCYASEGALPYAPAVAWLRTLRLPPLDKVWLAELSRLLPELLKGSSTPPAPLSESWQRLRLFEALARAILGTHKKTLLLLEDVHWCDQDTLEWLHYLLRFDPHAPLLVVATVRSEETASNPAYDRLVTMLKQEGSHLEIELGPLNETETGQLAACVAGKTLEQGVGTLLYQETEGNPLFIVETVRAELFKQARLPGMQPLPYKAHAVLENRIRQLSPDTRTLARLAATIGRAFPLDILRRASRASEAELIQGLDELLQRRIVREVAQNTFDFSHARLREAALVGISGAHGRLLHRQVAEALVSLAQHHREGRSGEIASHFEQAGCPGEAIPYYQLAADATRLIVANDLAIQYYQRAIALGETVDPDAHRPILLPDQLAPLYEKLGDLLALAGKYPEAQAAFERALAQPFASEGVWCARLYRKISLALMQQYQHPQAHAALDQAEGALNHLAGGGTLDERQEWIQVQLSRCDLLYWGNHADQMDVIIQKILPLVDVDGRPEQRIELLSQQLLARFRHERYRLSDATVEIARRKLELVSQLGIPYDIAWAQFLLGFSLLWHGQPLAAREWLDKTYDTAVRIGARLLQVRSLAYRSVVSRQLGDIQTLREQSPLLFELASAVGELDYQGFSQANQGWLAWRDGDLARAEALCHAAAETWKQSGGCVFHWLADWVLLAIAVARSDLARAENPARDLLDPNPLYQPLLAPVTARLEQALCACQAQDAAAAYQCFNQVLELVKINGDL